MKKKFWKTVIGIKKKPTYLVSAFFDILKKTQGLKNPRKKLNNSRKKSKFLAKFVNLYHNHFCISVKSHLQYYLSYTMKYLVSKCAD